ncbi:hypothetical protein [Lentibacillus juripiscarius]|uniref:Uncharacterized protein n=1 Tax=Lentibacillus juripiscarius TaxID=257446 RepID=A0ABW5V5U8_9BACI
MSELFWSAIIMVISGGIGEFFAGKITDKRKRSNTRTGLWAVIGIGFVIAWLVS